MMKIKRTTPLGAVLVAASLALTGCGDLLSVSNPGLIQDGTLDDPTVFGALVAGMSGDFSVANASSVAIAEMSFELQYGGADIGTWTLGVFEPQAFNGHWGNMQRARWVAEDGLRRMTNGLAPAAFAKSPLVARAHLLAGYSNKLLGENFCYAVFDEGPAQPRVEYFKRAEAHFTTAMATAQAAGASAASTYMGALAGRANVRAWQGNWDGAVQDAALVPAGFSYQALYSSNTAREENPYFFHTWRQWYGTGANTPWLTANDPRVTFTPALDAKGGVIKTRDGRWPGINQNRYLSLDAEMDIVTGREMLLLRAEAALRKKDLAGATTLMNASRATYNMATLGPLAVPGTEADAWKTLILERGATMYLEGRRFWDLTRWYTQGVDQQMKGRSLCWPISQQEMDSNPNLKGFTGL